MSNALQTIQQKLKVPKSQTNKFGGYQYRSQEDVLEAVKPLLTETNSILTLSDDIVDIGGSLFVKVTATLRETGRALSIGVAGIDPNESWSVTAFAKHSNEQKGMADAQITGSASSYARKYALNGLFLIDDTKDADATNEHKKETPASAKEEKPGLKASPKKETPAKSATPPPPSKPAKLEALEITSPNFEATKKRVKEGVKIEHIKKFFTITPEVEAELLKP